MSMEQAWDAQEDNLAYIIKPWPIGQKKKPNNCRKCPCLLKWKWLSLTRFSPTLAIKKQNLSYYTCRSRNTLFLGLESSLATLTKTCASHRRPCSQGHVVLQRCFRCVCLVVVSLGSVYGFGRQNRHLLRGRQQRRTQTLSGSPGSFFPLLFSLSVCFALCRSFVRLLLQPTSIEKTAVPKIFFPYHWFRSLTFLATPRFPSICIW